LFGVDTLQKPALLTWCVRTKDLDGCLAVARERGYDPGDPIEMSRRTSTGELLAWRLTPRSGVCAVLGTPKGTVSLG